MAKVSRNGKAKAAKPATAAVDTAGKAAGDNLRQAGTVAAVAGGVDGDGAGSAGGVAQVIPAGSPAEESRQPVPVEASASVSAGAPSGEGLGEVDTDRKVASETDAVASASDLSSSLDQAVENAMAKWPHFFAASEAWKAVCPDSLPTLIRISAKVEGFRRAGIAHSKAPTEHSIFDFDADRLEQLLAEPNLKVELV